LLLLLLMMMMMRRRRTGLGFCRGKKYFCQDSGKKTGKNHGKNRQKLTISLVH